MTIDGVIVQAQCSKELLLADMAKARDGIYASPLPPFIRPSAPESLTTPTAMGSIFSVCMGPRPSSHPPASLRLPAHIKFEGPLIPHPMRLEYLYQ